MPGVAHAATATATRTRSGRARRMQELQCARGFEGDPRPPEPRRRWTEAERSIGRRQTHRYCSDLTIGAETSTKSCCASMSARSILPRNVEATRRDLVTSSQLRRLVERATPPPAGDRLVAELAPWVGPGRAPATQGAARPPSLPQRPHPARRCLILATGAGAVPAPDPLRYRAVTRVRVKAAPGHARTGSGPEPVAGLTLRVALRTLNPDKITWD